MMGPLDKYITVSEDIEGRRDLHWWVPDHVHPKGVTNYTPTDLDCMQGFYCALGETVYFSIIIFDNDDIYDLSYQQYDFLYGTNYGEHQERVENVKGLLSQLSKGDLLNMWSDNLNPYSEWNGVTWEQTNTYVTSIVIDIYSAPSTLPNIKKVS